MGSPQTLELFPDQAPVSQNRHSSVLKPAPFDEWADFTLNTYVGCGHACKYCYATGYVPDADRKERWGAWVDVKQDAIAELRRDQRWRGKNLRIGTACDQYQPLEAQTSLTRQVLELFAEDEFGQPNVVLMTRGPLVLRDLDLLKKFKSLDVWVSITTDSEEMRHIFEPKCASIDRRFDLVAQLSAAGIHTAVNISPMLPLDDPQAFAARIVAVRPFKIFFDCFNTNTVPYRGSTPEKGWKHINAIGWTRQRYEEDLIALQTALRNRWENPCWSVQSAQKAVD